MRMSAPHKEAVLILIQNSQKFRLEHLGKCSTQKSISLHVTEKNPFPLFHLATASVGSVHFYCANWVKKMLYQIFCNECSYTNIKWRLLALHKPCTCKVDRPS